MMSKLSKHMSPINYGIPDSKIESVSTKKSSGDSQKYRQDIKDTNIETGESSYLTTKQNKKGKVTKTLIKPDNSGYKVRNGKGHKTSKLLNRFRKRKAQKNIDEANK